MKKKNYFGMQGHFVSKKKFLLFCSFVNNNISWGLSSAEGRIDQKVNI